MLGQPADIRAPTAADEAAWYDVMPKWQAAVSEFESVRDSLRDNLAQTPPDSALYAPALTVLTEMDNAESRIREIAAALTDVKAWLSGAWDTITGYWADAENYVLDFFGLSGLGLAPVVWLIGLGTVTAATAYVTKLTTDAINENSKLSAMRDLIDQGYTPAEASQAISKSVHQSFFGDMSEALKWGAVLIVTGGIGYYFLREKA